MNAGDNREVLSIQIMSHVQELTEGAFMNPHGDEVHLRGFLVLIPRNYVETQ